MKALLNEIMDQADVLNSADTQKDYDWSYPYFVRYFSDRAVITEYDFIIGSSFTYSWMPTILRYKVMHNDQSNKKLFDEKAKQAADILCRARCFELISMESLCFLSGIINNSLVGTSKLLHFVNPDVYAIWDSRVMKFLLGKRYRYSMLKDPQLYYRYLDLCHELTKHPDFNHIKEGYMERLGYQVSSLRVVEQILFLNSSQELTNTWEYLKNAQHTTN